MLAEAIVVKGNGGGRRPEALVAFKPGHLAVGADPADGHGELGRAPEGRLVKIPDVAAGIVLEAVAQHNADDVFSGLQGQRVGVVIDDVVRVGDVRRQRALGPALPVEKQLIKPAGADDHPGHRRGLQREGFAEAGGGHEMGQGAVIRGGTEKMLWKLHKIALLFRHNSHHIFRESIPYPGEKRNRYF